MSGATTTTSSEYFLLLTNHLEVIRDEMIQEHGPVVTDIIMRPDMAAAVRRAVWPQSAAMGPKPPDTLRLTGPRLWVVYSTRELWYLANSRARWAVRERREGRVPCSVSVVLVDGDRDGDRIVRHIEEQFDGPKLKGTP